MSQLSKQQRKEQLKRWKAVGRDEVIASMPITPQQLNQLLDYLEVNLTSCDHTTKLTAVFLDAENLDKGCVLPWFAEHGGYCDCEVLNNLDDLAESFRERIVPPKSKPKLKRQPREVRTITGWNLSTLPKPWRIANLDAPDEPLQIQLGKKGGCTVQIVESAMPVGDRMSDDYWSHLWYTRTELPERGPLRITHRAVDLPDHLRSTLVQSPRWLPVYCWIVPDDAAWYLEVQTELNRQQGDLPQVAALISGLEQRKA